MRRLIKKFKIEEKKFGFVVSKYSISIYLFKFGIYIGRSNDLQYPMKSHSLKVWDSKGIYSKRLRGLTNSLKYFKHS